MNDSPAERPPRVHEPVARNKNQRPRAGGREDELEALRRRATDWSRDARAAIERHPGIIVAAGAAAAVGFGVLLYFRAVRRRKDRRRDAFLDLANRLLAPSYAAEPPAPPRSVIKDTFKSAGGALAAAAGRELGRRALRAVTTDVTGAERHE